MSPTHDTEARLRAALHRTADRVDVDDYGSLDRIRSRTVTAQKRRRVVAAGAGFAMAVIAVTVVVSLMGDGRSGVTIAPAGTGEQPGSTTTTPTTAGQPTTSTTLAPPTIPPRAVFPATVADATDDPADTVERFLEALDYGTGYTLEVGTSDPVQEVSVRGLTEGGGPGAVRSVVSLEAQDGLYYVVGATSPDIVVESPAPGSTVTSPAMVSGRGRGFEAQLIVGVHDAELSLLNDPTEAAAIPLAGCCEELEPFVTGLPFGGDAGPGAVVVRNTSGLEEGAVGLVVVPVVLAPAGVTTFEVYLLDGERPVAVKRTVPKTQGVLRAAMEALLGGPNETEEADGLSSMFSDASAGMLLGVTIQPDGTAVVDLDPDLPDAIPNASTSAASTALLSQLELTVFQFENIQRVEFRLGGDCDAFFEWLERSCQVVDRP